MIIGVSGCIKVSFDLYIVFLAVHSQGAVAFSVAYCDITGCGIRTGRPALHTVIPAHDKRAPVYQERAARLDQVPFDGQGVTVQVKKIAVNVSVTLNDTVLCQGRG